MLPLSDGTLKTRVEGIAGEKREQIGLSLVPLGISVLFDSGGEAGNAADRLGTGGIDVVDVVEVKDAEVGGRDGIRRCGKGNSI